MMSHSNGITLVIRKPRLWQKAKAGIERIKASSKIVSYDSTLYIDSKNTEAEQQPMVVDKKRNQQEVVVGSLPSAI